jgi:uncharacterized phage protein gp47/JayE
MNAIIKGDPSWGAAIADGVNAVQLRTVQAELNKLQAVEGVRAEADKKRWERTRKRLARKYSTEPVGRLHGAILGVWALLWTAIFGAFAYLQAWNREA